MEYPMAYGWAILIISVVLAALFKLGVFSGITSPRARPDQCQVVRPYGPGSTSYINLAGVCTGQLPQYVAQFNGAGSRVYASSLPALSRSLTFSLLVYPTSFGTGADANVLDQGCTQSGYFVQVLTSGLVEFAIQCLGGSQVISSSPISLRKWSHIVATFDSSNNVKAIYINGAVSANTVPGTNTIITTGIKIGAGGDGYFSSSTANVQIYNTSLSASEIQGLYSEGIGGAPTRLINLVGWWPLNGDALDYGGNGNTGAILNGLSSFEFRQGSSAVFGRLHRDDVKPRKRHCGKRWKSICSRDI